MKARVLLFVLAAFFLRAEDPAEQPLTRTQIRHLLQQARNLYRDDDAEPEELADAAQAFGLAANQAEPGEVDLDAVRFAEALAWMRTGQPDRALEAFGNIQGFPLPEQRARHRFHRGNAHLAAGEQALTQDDFQSAKQQMEEAIENYIASLQEDPQAESAKQNLEIARRRRRWGEENAPPPPPPEEDGEDDEESEDQDDPEERETPQDMPPPTPEDEQDQEQDAEMQHQPGEDEEGVQDQPQDGDEETDADDPTPAAPDLVEDVDGEAPQDDPDLEDLTEEESRRTLDRLFEQERRRREEILHNRHRDSPPVEKDW